MQEHSGGAERCSVQLIGLWTLKGAGFTSTHGLAKWAYVQQDTIRISTLTPPVEPTYLV